jgi:RNA polymerase sigma-70 factor (ECF subfamily)
VQTNGQPAVLVRRDGEPVALLTLEASDAGIERIMWVMARAKGDCVASLA